MRHDEFKGPQATAGPLLCFSRVQGRRRQWSYSIRRGDIRRQIRSMFMDGLANLGANKKGPILDRLEQELLAFRTNPGMMVCRFEGIDGRRY